MSLDFQQLTTDIEKMARAAGGRNVTRQTLLDEVLLFLHNNANAWDALEDAYPVSYTHLTLPTKA